MKIQEKIKADLKTAMIEKNEERKSILRVVIGEFNRVGKDVADDKAIGIIKKMVVNANEQNNTNEAQILESYLPQQMDETELRKVCMNFIMNLENPSMKDMGKTMGYLKQNYASLYDGKQASQLVKELLAN